MCLFYDWRWIVPIILLHAGYFFTYLTISFLILKLRPFIEQSTPNVISAYTQSSAYFILWCGLTHFMAIIMYFKGWYWALIVILLIGNFYNAKTLFLLYRNKKPLIRFIEGYKKEIEKEREYVGKDSETGYL